jgi:hypothetical protein
MKSFGRPSFFRLFDLLVSKSNPGLTSTLWTFDGVQFERERHSFTGPKHGLVIEIVTLTHSGRRSWCLMVTKEYWWAGAETKALKSLRWARPTSGQRNDILAWLRKQEAAFDRELAAQWINPSETAEGEVDYEEDDESTHEGSHPLSVRHR